MAMSDITKMMLWQAGLSVPGAILGARGDSQDAAANREISLINANANLLNTYGNYLQGAGGTAGYSAALDSIGSPLAHAQQRADFAKKRSFLFDGPGGGPQYIRPQGYMNSYLPSLPRFDSAKPFFSDSAMLASEMPYWQSVSALTGGKVAPGFQAAGYESQPAALAQYALNQSLYRDAYEKAQRDAKFEGMLTAQQQALNQSLQGGQQQKKKTPWWKKALGIGGMIGSMFIPGGGLIAGLARAGLGAASGALAGGTKGAILGGAMGGISSLPIKGIQNIPGIGSAPAAKGMSGLKNLATGNFMGTLPSKQIPFKTPVMTPQGGMLPQNAWAGVPYLQSSTPSWATNSMMNNQMTQGIVGKRLTWEDILQQTLNGPVSQLLNRGRQTNPGFPQPRLWPSHTPNSPGNYGGVWPQLGGTDNPYFQFSTPWFAQWLREKWGMQ